MKNVGMQAHSSILGKCFGHIEKWVGPNVTLGSLLKLCLLGYQTNLTNVPKHERVFINSGIVAAACWFPWRRPWSPASNSSFARCHECTKRRFVLNVGRILSADTSDGQASPEVAAATRRRPLIAARPTRYQAKLSSWSTQANDLWISRTWRRDCLTSENARVFFTALWSQQDAHTSHLNQ